MHIIMYYNYFSFSLYTFIFFSYGVVNLGRYADYLMFGFFERSENRWVLMLDQAAPGGLIKYNLPLQRGSASTACKTSNIFHENRLNG